MYKHTHVCMHIPKVIRAYTYIMCCIVIIVCGSSSMVSMIFV